MFELNLNLQELLKMLFKERAYQRELKRNSLDLAYSLRLFDDNGCRFQVISDNPDMSDDVTVLDDIPTINKLRFCLTVSKSNDLELRNESNDL